MEGSRIFQKILAADVRNVGSPKGQSKLIVLAKVEKNELELDTDALFGFLSQPNLKGKPLVVISISGAYRSGKSFMMNFFLRYLQNKGWQNKRWFGTDDTEISGGFPWRRGKEPCTKGITVWPEVFYVPTTDGREAAVIMVDTQGLFDQDTSPDINAKLMAISTLFSSHQILNLKGQIEERDLEHLQLCVTFANAAARTQLTKDAKPFQKLTFLLRDFEQEDCYGDGTEKYLGDFFGKQSHSSEVQEVKNSIRNAFDKVACFMLPHPGKRVVRRKEGQTLRNQDLDEEFCDYVPDFVSGVLHTENLTIKRSTDGQEETPMRLINRLSLVRKSFTAGKIPKVEVLLTSVIKARNSSAVTSSVQKYKKNMGENCKEVLSQISLDSHHRQALELAKKHFHTEANIGDGKSKIEFIQQLERECKTAFNDFTEKNENRKSVIKARNSSAVTSSVQKYKKNMGKNYLVASKVRNVGSPKGQKESQLVVLAKVENDNLELDTDALYKFMKQPEIEGRPLVVISIAGAFRSGKSFILNFLLRYLRNRGWENKHWFGNDDAAISGGFPFKSGAEACTQGITIWPEVFSVPTNNGKQAAVIIVDTQGLFDSDTSPDINAKLMSISTLFSSHQILNIMRQIEERDLEHLQLCIAYAKAASRLRGSDDTKPFQKLTFLVRDWEREDDFGDGTKQYLRNYFGKRSRSREFQEVKDSIPSAFDEVACTLLPHPDIDEEFREYASEFVSRVLQPKNLAIKRSGDGREETAAGLMNLLGTVCKSFQAGKLPKAETLLTARDYEDKIVREFEKEVTKYEMEYFDDLKSILENLVRQYVRKYDTRLASNDRRNPDNLIKRLNDISRSRLKLNERNLAAKSSQFKALLRDQCISYEKNMIEISSSVTEAIFNAKHEDYWRQAMSAFDAATLEYKNSTSGIATLRWELSQSISSYYEVAKKVWRERKLRGCKQSSFVM